MNGALPPNAIGSRVRQFGNLNPKVEMQPFAIFPADGGDILPLLPRFSMSSIGEGR